MPASGFLISCAITAAISPSAASRSRSRSRSSICSTWVRSLKNSAAPIVSPSLVADERQRVADHLVGGLQAQLGAVGQRRQLEGAAEHAHDVGMLAEDVGVRLPEIVGIGRQAENPAGLVVDAARRRRRGRSPARRCACWRPCGGRTRRDVPRCGARRRRGWVRTRAAAMAETRTCTSQTPYLIGRRPERSKSLAITEFGLCA